MLSLHRSSSTALLEKYIPVYWRQKPDYDLIEIYQSPDSTPYLKRKALETLTYRYIAVLKNHTKRLSGSAHNEDCLLQAWEGFVKAVERFDLNNHKKVKFLTYAYWYIRKGAQSWLSAKSKEDKVSFLGWTSDMSETFSSQDNTAERDTISQVRAVISRFPGNQEVVKAFYGICHDKLTYSQIAKEFRLPESECQSQIKKFRRYAHYELLQ